MTLKFARDSNEAKSELYTTNDTINQRSVNGTTSTLSFILSLDTTVHYIRYDLIISICVMYINWLNKVAAYYLFYKFSN